MIDRLTQCVYNLKKMNRNLQGEVRFLTGGKAHEPKGMIRCNSEADSIVWMKEDMDKQDLKDRFKRLVR